jgi:hypothetical protein
LKTADYRDQQVIEVNRIAVLALDAVRVTVPCLQPKLLIGAAAVTRKVKKQRSEFVHNHQCAGRPRLYQFGEPFNRRITDV